MAVGVRPRRRCRLDRAGPPERLRDQADGPAAARGRAVGREDRRPGPRKAEKDIFEDTDFEVDAWTRTATTGPSSSRPASDFDLEEAESGSEVFAIDEDDVDQNAATALGPGSSTRGRGRGGRRLGRRRGEIVGSAWDVESESRPGPDPARPRPRSWHPRPRRPSGAASGSACSGSRPSSCSC